MKYKTIMLGLFVALASICIAQPAANPKAGPPIKRLTIDNATGEAVIVGADNKAESRIKLPPLLKREEAEKMMGVPIGKAPTKSGPAVVVLSRYPDEFADNTSGIDREWIKSNANPMKERIVMPEGKALARDWKNKTPEQKAQFVEVYRRCGYHIIVEETNVGIRIKPRRIK